MCGVSLKIVRYGPEGLLPCISIDANVRQPEDQFAGKAMTIDVVYKIILHRDGCEAETIYWSGSREETISLARKVALKCHIDLLRVIDFSCSGGEIYSESAPFRQAIVNHKLN